jgi:deoxyribodipyrimidine photo-lyase
LRSLARDIAARGSSLIVRDASRQGALAVLRELIDRLGADGVCWNVRFEPQVLQRDAGIESALRMSGCWTHACNGALLSDPRELKNLSGQPYQVFTPYWRRVLELLGDPAAPWPTPARLPVPAAMPQEPIEAVQKHIDALGLLPRLPWDIGLAATWQPGEAGARARLARFVARALAGYAEDRDRPTLEGTSRLSPHLHFGEISPRQIWHATARAAESAGASAAHRKSQFITELGWREFAHYLLLHFPRTPERPLRAQFERFPWADDPSGLQAWQRGRTGVPIVDAGMRQLWHEGWMHNRVRMIAGSLLVKNLQVNWLEGARWFWDTLVDADLANNTLGWQWVAGCGADAAPYFRVFNPHTQAQKFDPDGAYVRCWVPEAGDPDRYPQPLVNLATSRIAALAAYESMRAG